MIDLDFGSLLMPRWAGGVHLDRHSRVIARDPTLHTHIMPDSLYATAVGGMQWTRVRRTDDGWKVLR